MAQHDQLTREATLDRGQADKALRTVRASLSSETPIMRAGGPETLRHDPQSINLTRAAGGLPLLFGHDRNAPAIGVVENVRIDNRRLVGDLRFGQSQRAQEIFADVADGILRSVSISYSIQAEEPAKGGGYVATRWTPYEASIVSVPADHSVGVGRSAQQQIHSQGSTNMQQQSQNQQAAGTGAGEVATQIRAMCARHKLGDGFANRMVDEGLDIERAREAILDEVATRDEQQGNSARNVVSQAWIYGGGQDGQHSRGLIEEALSARMGGARPSATNPYVHQRVLDMARERCEINGVRTAGLSPSQIFERAFTTSDFPNLLENSLNKVLAAKYMSYPGGLRRACRPSTAKDFRAKSVLRLGETPSLVKVNEHGEYKQGSMADAKESYAIGTFGRIVSISRQALINDDLQAFETLGLRFAQSSVEFEAGFLVDLLTSNPTMNEDGVALFHADHGNLTSGGGSVLQLSSLASARKAMRLQKGLDGITAIDATPKFLIVPAALELTAEQLLTQITPVQVEQVNPFGGKLELIVDPRLDAVSATAWYLAADPAMLDTIEYAYLDGESGPQIFIEQGFEIDGMSMKCREDFGAGVLDWRGLYKSAGA
jgi:hypothetical protein